VASGARCRVACPTTHAHSVLSCACATADTARRPVCVPSARRRACSTNARAGGSAGAVRDRTAAFRGMSDIMDVGGVPQAPPPPTPLAPVPPSPPERKAAGSLTPWSPSAPCDEEVGARVDLHDFLLLKVLGKGTFGKVMQVRKKDNGRVYAMKVLNKANVIRRKQVAHTQTERNVLGRIVHPFIVGLNFAFQVRGLCLPRAWRRRPRAHPDVCACMGLRVRARARARARALRVCVASVSRAFRVFEMPDPSTILARADACGARVWVGGCCCGSPPTSCTLCWTTAPAESCSSTSVATGSSLRSARASTLRRWVDGCCVLPRLPRVLPLLCCAGSLLRHRVRVVRCLVVDELFVRIRSCWAWSTSTSVRSSTAT
jgi:hypothetical protein